ncbi:hypothetical protein BD410DRAFT_831963 [Rickenella mellea]|uniref:Uncharacterized protein n=1 Tax=Rickenella mellea TaxID=50990 RepID=A0A4Y7PN24_9AGAM|nr:hypothetical protein BD410DRAFT_831963 [Rickenella mellea]
MAMGKSLVHRELGMELDPRDSVLNGDGSGNAYGARIGFLIQIITLLRTTDNTTITSTATNLTHLPLLRLRIPFMESARLVDPSSLADLASEFLASASSCKFRFCVGLPEGRQRKIGESDTRVITVLGWGLGNARKSDLTKMVVGARAWTADTGVEKPVRTRART